MLNPDKLIKDIKAIQDDLSQRVSYPEFLDFKNGYSNIIKLDNTIMQIDFMNENLNRLLDDSKVDEEIKWLRRKLEALASSIQNLKADDGNGNNSRKDINFDFSKYLETSVFADFQKTYTREVNNLYDRMLDSKNLIEAISALLKTMASEKDLRNLESH